jgi:hypothetical protein
MRRCEIGGIVEGTLFDRATVKLPFNLDLGCQFLSQYFRGGEVYTGGVEAQAFGFGYQVISRLALDSREIALERVSLQVKPLVL